MRYLKLYEEFNEIPSNFIRLDSIGHVLDPEEGVIYVMWEKGGYDHENPYDVKYDSQIEGISDEDREIVGKAINLTNEQILDIAELKKGEAIVHNSDV